jgi:hypothetical protein
MRPMRGGQAVNSLRASGRAFSINRIERAVKSIVKNTIDKIVIGGKETRRQGAKDTRGSVEKKT